MQANGSPLESAIARVGFRGCMSANELLEEVNDRFAPGLSERQRATVQMLLEELRAANDALSEHSVVWGKMRDCGSTIGADYLGDPIRRQHEALCTFLSACACCDGDEDSLERVAAVRADQDAYVREMIAAFHAVVAGADGVEQASQSRH